MEVRRGSSSDEGGQDTWVVVVVLGHGSWLRKLVQSRAVVRSPARHLDAVAQFVFLVVVVMRMMVLHMMDDGLPRWVLRCLCVVWWARAT